MNFEKKNGENTPWNQTDCFIKHALKRDQMDYVILFPKLQQVESIDNFSF